MTPAPVAHDPGNLTAPQAVDADTLERALERYVELAGRPYVAVPFLLTYRLGGAYPLGPLAGDPRLCCSHALAGGTDVLGRGFDRDELAGVDWYCLLDAAHDGICGYVLDAAAVADAAQAGYLAELTPVDEDLDDELAVTLAD